MRGPGYDLLTVEHTVIEYGRGSQPRGASTMCKTLNSSSHGIRKGTAPHWPWKLDIGVVSRVYYVLESLEHNSSSSLTRG